MKNLLILLALFSTMAFAKKTILLTKDNHVLMDKPFNITSVSTVQYELLNLIKNKSMEEVYLVLNSPGGSVSAGNLLIDFIKSLDVKVHTITIFSASMAYNTVQQLGKRYILPSGILMSHRARMSGLGGQFPGELNKRLGLYMDIVEVMSKKAAKRVGITYKEYSDLIHDELWLTSNKAVALGHADEIANIKCHSDLNELVESEYNTFFGVIKFKKSKCPLMVGPVDVKGSAKAIQSFMNKQKLMYKGYFFRP